VKAPKWKSYQQHEVAHCHILALGQLHTPIRRALPECRAQYACAQLVLQVENREQQSLVGLGKLLESRQVDACAGIDLLQLSEDPVTCGNEK
jgi:hypothetical protein